MSANNYPPPLEIPDTVVAVAQFTQMVKRDRKSTDNEVELFHHTKIPRLSNTSTVDWRQLDIDSIIQVSRNGSIAPSQVAVNDTSAIRDNRDRFPPFLPIDYDKYQDVSNQCKHEHTTVCEQDREVIDTYWSYCCSIDRGALAKAQQRAGSLSTYMESGLSHESIEQMNMGFIQDSILLLQQYGMTNEELIDKLKQLGSTTVESNLESIRESSSCHVKGIPLVFCPCGTVNRNCSVYCPKCHRRCITDCDGECYKRPVSTNPRCYHVNKYYSEDVTVVFYYPVMYGLLDGIFSGNDEFMHSLTNRERLVNAVFASENDIICQDTSVNAYAVSHHFGDDEICSILRKSFENRESPLSHMGFLVSEVKFAEMLTSKSCFSVVPLSIGYVQSLSDADKLKEIESFKEQYRMESMRRDCWKYDADFDDISDNDETDEEEVINGLIAAKKKEVPVVVQEVQEVTEPPEQPKEASQLDPKPQWSRGGRLRRLFMKEAPPLPEPKKQKIEEVTYQKVKLDPSFDGRKQLTKFDFQNLNFVKIQEYYFAKKELQADEKQWYTSVGLKPTSGNYNSIRVSLLVWCNLRAHQLKNEYSYLNETCFRDSLTQFFVSRNQTVDDHSLDTCQIQTILKEIDQLNSSADTGTNPAPNPASAAGNQENKDDGKIQFNHPGKDVDVIELRVCGTLQIEDSPLFESIADNQPYLAISFAIQSCNPSDQPSSAFKLYLGIIRGFNDGFSRAFKEIQLSTTVLGKYGCFFKKDGQWYHLTWFVQGIMSDYPALTYLPEHFTSSFPCVFCPAEKKLYNPLYEAMLPSTWTQVFDARMMRALDSSLNFVNPNSLYRMSSIVYQLLIQNKDSLLDQLMKDTQPVAPRNLMEYYQLKELFSYLDHSYLVMWTPPVLTSKDSLQRVIQLTESATQGVHYKAFQTILNKCKEDLAEQQMEPPATGKDKRQQTMLLLPEGGVYFVDPVRLYSNIFKRFCDCLDNKLPKFGSSSYYFDFDQLFKTVVTPSSRTKPPGIVPKLVNVLACRRIRELDCDNVSWLHPFGVTRLFFGDLSDEQRVVFYFCLFTYAYQDSLTIPVVYLMNVVVGIMSELFIMNRNYCRASILQARLSTYLGLLESNLAPNFSSTDVHLPNHIYHSILFHGPLYEYSGIHQEETRENFEPGVEYAELVREYNEKRAETRLVSPIGYSRGIQTFNVSQMAKSPVPITMSLDCDKWVLCSLVDDYVFSMNASMPHDTYMDHVFSKTEEKWEHRYGYLKDKVPKPCEGKTTYYSLEWNDQYYETVLEENPKKPSVKWLQQNMRYVAFTRGFDNCLYYFIVRGFRVYKVNKISYPVAICSPIKVQSISHGYYSYYCLKLADDWDSGLHDHVMLSLYRITMGSAVLLPFANRTVWGIAPMTLKLLAFNDIPRDKLFENIKNHVKEMCK